jgi:hypothetical protein
MIRPNEIILKRIETTQRFVPFEPAATSYGFACNAMEVARYLEPRSTASGEFSAPQLLWHGAVLPIRPGERFDMRYVGISW